MITFYIKKEVVAKDAADAIRKESNAQITEVWKKEEQTKTISAIGFDAYRDENDDDY